ncbi:MBL fold metallo-hydrolase [Bailinhaonella thermotolerans]|uniref:MBL fold metallo-hydrolase n=1 Tax=Bailinhaonella thermotolerans TaxID=1070861 RepID=A0A3A4AQP5_9ACTN|nr:MBL fold metallo-hydrolase [Bailinhaonella thermotolerans]RJL23578.1 MBL fold metallo-hydrolase [Bailinhaonella thermotolerans]
MRVTVMGASGAFPTAREACSGFLVEHEGFRLLVDLGYGTAQRIMDAMPVEDVDAVLVSHGHPDHCADLNPLLRARALRDDPAAALPVYAPPRALDAVLALDRPGMLDDAYRLREFEPGAVFEAGPFRVETRALPHMPPNAGMRISAGGRTLAYTGDSGPSPDVAALARDAGLLVAEASYAEEVPAGLAGHLSSARQRGEQAARADAARLWLTHLMPGVDPGASAEAAAGPYAGEIRIASGGLTLDLD